MKNKVKATGTVDFQKAISYLEELLEKLKDGEIVVTHGGNSVAFHPKDAVEIEIGAKIKDGKEKFSFEMCAMEGLQPGEMVDFSISSGDGLSTKESMDPKHDPGKKVMMSESRSRRESKHSGEKKTSDLIPGEIMRSDECVSWGSLEAPASCSEL